MNTKLIRNPLRTNTKKFNGFNKLGNIIIIRHAESHFNQEIHNLEKFRTELSASHYSSKKSEIRFGLEYCDSPLTDKGLEQCYTAGKSLKGVNIKYIFVSPLKRTLMTCKNILEFSDTKAEVIVHPFLFEKIEDSCDLLDDIKQNMLENKSFNWNLFEGMAHLPAYQLKYCDMTIKNYLNSYYHNSIDHFYRNNNYNHKYIATEGMKQLNKNQKYIESSSKTFERLFIFKSFIDNFIQQKRIINEEQILIVGHSVLFKHLTCEFINNTNYEPCKNSKVLKNCEISSVSFYD